MTTSNKIETILVELDCILDTRLGTLAKMGVDTAVRALQNAYHTREHDVFEGVDTEEFKRAYRERNVETLQHSGLTLLSTMLRGLAQNLSEMAITRPYFDGVKIAVNTYPYQLNPELVEAIGKAVAVHVGSTAPVELVTISPQALTPTHVKANYAMLFMYDFQAWMEVHAQAFATTRLPDVSLIAPALYFGERPDQKTLQDLVRDAAHPFAAMTMLASGLVGLELIDIKYFSIIKPQDDATA